MILNEDPWERLENQVQMKNTPSNTNERAEHSRIQALFGRCGGGVCKSRSITG